MQFSLEDAATGLLVLIGGVLSWFGIQNGRRASKQPGQGGDFIELAGAIIDKDQAKELIGAVRENTRALQNQVGAVEAFQEDLREVKSEVRDVLRELRSELKETVRDLRQR
jgi:predicted  nucleic acid-binding Zn-ribbon protein